MIIHISPSSLGKGIGCDHGQIPCSSFGKGGWWWWSWPYTLLPLLGKGRGEGDHIHPRSFVFWDREGARVTMARYPLVLPIKGMGGFLFWESEGLVIISIHMPSFSGKGTG